jgi:hypothetical protein
MKDAAACVLERRRTSGPAGSWATRSKILAKNKELRRIPARRGSFMTSTPFKYGGGLGDLTTFEACANGQYSLAASAL